MPKIRVYGNFDFTNDSDCCTKNGELTILIDVPKSWVKWNKEKRQKWLDKNYDKINKEFNSAMYVSHNYGYYDDIEEIEEIQNEIRTVYKNTKRYKA